jgi:hypothetical protein
VAVRRIDDVRLDRQVVAYEIRRVGVVGVNASHLRGSEEHVLGALRGKELLDRRLIAQVELRARAQHEVRAGRSEPAHDRAADEPAVACDEDARLLIHDVDTS